MDGMEQMGRDYAAVSSERILLEGGSITKFNSTTQKWENLLTRRQFPCEESLRIHVETSTLYKDCLVQAIKDDRLMRPTSSILTLSGVVTWFSQDRGYGFIQESTAASPGSSKIEDADSSQDASSEASGLFFHGSQVVAQLERQNNQAEMSLSTLARCVAVGTSVTFTRGFQKDGRQCAEQIMNRNRNPFVVHQEPIKLPSPKTVQRPQRAAFAIGDHLLSATDSWQGHKKTNEDRFVRHDIGSAGSFFGLYDGHGGETCASFVLKRFHAAFKTCLLKKKAPLPYPSLVKAVYIEACKVVDKEYLAMAESKNLSDGSCSLSAFVYGSSVETAEISVANLGDSRVVMCRDGRGVRLSSDHKPDRPDERRRIENMGGYVGQVKGVWRLTTASGAGMNITNKGSLYLAVSRAFGDASLKQPTPLVSSTPEIRTCPVGPDDLFCVLACDGVWDVLSDQEVVDVAAEHFDDPKKGATSVARLAFQRGSQDNITVTVIQFKWQASKVAALLEKKNERKEGTPTESGAVGEEIDIFA